MDVRIAVTGGAGTEDLRRWMDRDPELAGRARTVAGEPEPGTLGTLDVLAMAVGQGGMATALAGGLVAWLRRRVGDVEVTVRRPDGSQVSLTARNVRRLSPDEVAELVRSLEGDIGDRP
jgi:hypothetical protein